MKYEIPNPQKQLAILSDKYDLGKITNNLSEIKNIKPIFAFDFLSFSKSNFCFNSNLINAKKDYLKLLESLKKISSLTFDELSKNRTYHFHDVDFSDTHPSESDFLKSIVQDSSKLQDSNTPTVYQFKLFEESRIFGFFYRGVFYPVWFDRNHLVYKRK
jgi:hypothetical protein